MTQQTTIEPAIVKKQLKRILASSGFIKSSILSNFLSFVVNETLEGKEKYIKEYVIATSVLKKKPEFNPQLDAIVRIHARRLRKHIEAYYETTGKNDPLKIWIPKGCYIPVFEDNIIQNIKLTDDIRQIQVVDKKHDRPILIVLPFRCYTKDVKSEMFASVLSYDLSIELTHYQELRIICNNSAVAISEKFNSLEKVGEELGADYLLNGSCIWSDNKFRISAELVSVIDMEQVWAEIYTIEGFEEDIYGNLSNVIRKITTVISGFFGLIYRDYFNRHSELISEDFSYIYTIFWFNQYQRYFSLEAFKESLKHATLANEKNPNNPFILSLLAELNLNLHLVDHGLDYDPIERGLSFANMAIQLDGNFQYAHKSFAWAGILRHNKREFLRAAEKCISINPNNMTMKGIMGFGYICIGEYDKGCQYQSEAYELDPYAPWYFNLGFSFYYIIKGDFEEALHWAHKCNRTGFHWDPLIRACTFGLLEQKENAQEPLNELFRLCPGIKNNSRKIIETFLLDDELVNRIQQGLIKAGVDIKDS